MEEVVQPYISIEVNPQSVELVCAKLAQTLTTLGISVERNTQNFHVSLAYVLGNCDKSVLAQIAQKIAANKLEAKISGVEILEGQTTGYDYVALSFESNNQFASCSEEISKELSTREFDGGFRTHLTLFRMKKGALNKTSLESVCECLSKNCEQQIVSAEAVSVFNSSYEKQLSVAV